MRKIYLTTCLTLAAGFTFAQQGNFHNGFELKAKPSSEVVVPEVSITDGTMERGSAFWMEDFANGMSSTNGTWTVDGTDGLIWKQDFYGTSGCWSGNTPTPATSTAANGFMLFDADSANCIDASTNPPTFTQTALMGGLVSPTIDCSSQPSVLLTFEQSLRYCCSAALTLYVYVSDDGGSTWSTPIDVLYGLAVNAQSPNPQTVAVNISCYTNNSSNVKIKFEWNGVSHYYWAVDDITLSPAPNDALRLNTSTYWNETRDAVFGVPVDYPIVPADQIDNLVLRGELDNQGGNQATNTVLTYKVLNGSSSVIASGSSTPVDMPVCAAARQDSAIWAHSTTPDTYTINYKADYDNFPIDTDTTNNLKSASVQTVLASNNGTIAVQYARDNNIATGAGLWNGAGEGYIMGNVFQVYNNTTLYSIDACFTSSSTDGVIACIILYEMDPGATAIADVFVPVVDQCLDGVEYTLSTSDFSTSTTMDWYSFPINATSPGTGYALQAGKQYLAAISHYAGVEELVIQNGGQTPNGDASVWIYSQTDATWYYMTSKPKIRLGFDPTLGTNELETENLSMSQNAPNPASGTTAIGYSVAKVSDLNFTVTDVTGKIVYTEYIGKKGQGAYNFQLNTADFAAGVYYYTLSAGDENLTKKMVITK